MHPASAALFDTDDSDKLPAKSGLSALAGNITGIFAKSKSGEGAAGGDAADAADADDDEDGTSAERFELKAPENPPSIKRGPYRIYVHLHEARDMRSSNDPAKRAQGMELAGKIAQCAHDLGVENVLVVPGAVHIPWRTDHEPVANDVCDARAREAVGQLAKQAEKLKVCLNIENIFFNGYLMTPMEMNAFVDGIGSEHVRVHFDTGNISMFQFPEHWAKVLGKRTKNVHLKEFTKKGTDFSLETFRPLLDGTTNWPAVTDALADTGYKGFLTFEYFHPYAHYPEALIWQTSDSLDRILGRKN